MSIRPSKKRHLLWLQWQHFIKKDAVYNWWHWTRMSFCWSTQCLEYMYYTISRESPTTVGISVSVPQVNTRSSIMVPYHLNQLFTLYTNILPSHHRLENIDNGNLKMFKQLLRDIWKYDKVTKQEHHLTHRHTEDSQDYRLLKLFIYRTKSYWENTVESFIFFNLSSANPTIR